ncbi:hypothetical protein ABG067_006586 [Albugo candida]|uniref:NADH dehydrogenase [ubiquinone] 1 alpha subcomplex subunit 4 n=1 Tax=Albugo candida TaxID=65357 RepID=A0A024GNI4_9STRA|nr:unnamed protein product [Albugo candida]|eukprot:CCI48418.1 unnamed protein product [Albugo candida]
MRSGQRVVQSAIKRWLGDPGTYPIIVVCGFAGALCTYQCGRYLFGHPDISWNKTSRNNTLKHDPEVGEKWQSHRVGIATIRKNAVNEAKGLYKEE